MENITPYRKENYMNFLKVILDNEKLIILTLAATLITSLVMGEAELAKQIATGMIGFYSGTKIAESANKN